MKKLINQPEHVLEDSLRGLAAAHADLLRVSFDPIYIARADAPVRGKVAVVSGGGSGHEPMHGGFVGKGMLDAACPGQVFTSPTPDQVEAASRAVHGGAGVLHIIKNYSGDIMNFEMAAELCHGIEIRSVVINDDVAIENSLYTTGRRGVGVTVIAEKIAGAAAARGYDLSRVESLCRRVNENGRSMGMALTSCTVPAAGRPTFQLAEDEMEVGIGIHGEPGQERRPLMTARDIAERMTGTILADLPFREGDRVIVLMNGMGGTPLLELYLMYQEVVRVLGGSGIGVARCLVGNYITSLEMAGCSITLVRAGEEMLALWDDPVVTPGLRWGA
ncbi:MAG: dihydroxyacetone kinase subunit DhaK [Bryobacteraceae bacterium]